jgi:hypothetical protein
MFEIKDKESEPIREGDCMFARSYTAEMLRVNYF